ncbi:hypothetical protein ACFVUH_35230 [Kitasatospora sp. NPDC058032]|uniref:hypothetical protein n=1 Tax=unclassified Kitasatospora TaxID=2633591 RepID=UPI0033B42AC9
MIEYELIKQQGRELRAEAEHQRLVRAARTAERAGRWPSAGRRTRRRAVRPGEC